MKYELIGGRFDGGEVDFNEIPIGGIMKIPMPLTTPPTPTPVYHNSPHDKPAFQILYYQHLRYGQLTYVEQSA